MTDKDLRVRCLRVGGIGNFVKSFCLFLWFARGVPKLLTLKNIKLAAKDLAFSIEKFEILFFFPAL